MVSFYLVLRLWKDSLFLQRFPTFISAGKEAGGGV